MPKAQLKTAQISFNLGLYKRSRRPSHVRWQKNAQAEFRFSHLVEEDKELVFYRAKGERIVIQSESLASELRENRDQNQHELHNDQLIKKLYLYSAAHIAAQQIQPYDNQLVAVSLQEAPESAARLFEGYLCEQLGGEVSFPHAYNEAMYVDTKPFSPATQTRLTVFTQQKVSSPSFKTVRDSANINKGGVVFSGNVQYADGQSVPVSFAAVHLESKSRVKRSYEYWDILLQQLPLELTSIEHLYELPSLCVQLGDFNTRDEVSLADGQSISVHSEGAEPGMAPLYRVLNTDHADAGHHTYADSRHAAEIVVNRDKHAFSTVDHKRNSSCSGPLDNVVVLPLAETESGELEAPQREGTKDRSLVFCGSDHILVTRKVTTEIEPSTAERIKQLINKLVDDVLKDEELAEHIEPLMQDIDDTPEKLAKLIPIYNLVMQFLELKMLEHLMRQQATTLRQKRLKLIRKDQARFSEKTITQLTMSTMTDRQRAEYISKHAPATTQAKQEKLMREADAFDQHADAIIQIRQAALHKLKNPAHKSDIEEKLASLPKQSLANKVLAGLGKGLSYLAQGIMRTVCTVLSLGTTGYVHSPKIRTWTSWFDYRRHEACETKTFASHPRKDIQHAVRQCGKRIAELARPAPA